MKSENLLRIGAIRLKMLALIEELDELTQKILAENME